MHERRLVSLALIKMLKLIPMENQVRQLPSEAIQFELS